MQDLDLALRTAAETGQLPLAAAHEVRRSAQRRRTRRRWAVLAIAALAAPIVVLDLTPIHDEHPAPPATPAPTSTRVRSDGAIPAPGDPAMFDGFTFPEEQEWTDPRLVEGGPPTMPQPCDGGMNLADATPGRVAFEDLPGGRYRQRSVAGFADEDAATEAIANLNSAAQDCEGWLTGQMSGVGDDALGLAKRSGASVDFDVLVVRVGTVVWAGWSKPAAPAPPTPGLGELKSAYWLTEPRLRTISGGGPSPEVSVGDLRPGHHERLAGVRLALETTEGAETSQRPAVVNLACDPDLRLSSETPARTARVGSDTGYLEASVIALRDRYEVAEALKQARRLLASCAGSHRDTEAGPPSFTVSGQELTLGDGAVALAIRTINGTGGTDVLIVALDDLLYLAQAGDGWMPEQQPFDARLQLREQFVADKPQLIDRDDTPLSGPTD